MATIKSYTDLEQSKKIEQKSAWSEEDEEMLKMVMKSCEQCGNEYAYYWLTSIKERIQSRWKPSEELLDVFIKNAIDFFESNFNPLTDGGVIGAFDDKEKMIEEFKEYMKEEGFNEEWI